MSLKLSALLAIVATLLGGLVLVAIVWASGMSQAELQLLAGEMGMTPVASALVLAGIVYRALSWRTLYGVLRESTRSSAVITMIIAGAFMLNYAFTSEGVPQALAQWVDGLELSPLQFLLLVAVTWAWRYRRLLS